MLGGLLLCAQLPQFWREFEVRRSGRIYLSYTIDCSFIRVSRGLVGVWFRIYIYIAIPKVVRVWHFTVPGSCYRVQCIIR